VSDRGFEIPEDHRDRSQIEGGMRAHQHPDSPSDGEDRPEHEARDSRLLDTSQPLPEVMERRKHGGGYEHGDDPGGQAPSEQFAESFEHVSAEYGFFPEARDDNHGQDGIQSAAQFPAR